MLLVDDTWTKGGSAQSAAAALRDAGASPVALLPVQAYGTTNAKILEGRHFSWDVCALERV